MTPSIGFRNGAVICKNITFDYTTNPQPANPGIINANGQLLIASIGDTPNLAMKAGFLTSTGNTIAITYDAPNLNLEVNGGGSGIVTLTGNTGGALASNMGNFDVKTANSTVIFAGTVGSQLLDFGLDNLLIGVDGSTITTADQNVSLGAEALSGITTGLRNVAIGFNSCPILTTASNNVSVGVNTLSALTTGTGENVAVGENALANLASGEDNVALGTRAGQNYTAAEFSNICIASDGVAGDFSTIRIGTNLTHISAFFQGIYGVNVPGSAPVSIDAAGQLGTLGFGNAGQVLTSNGNLASPTWQAGGSSAITYTGNTGGALSPAVNLDIKTADSTFVFAGAGSALTLDFTDPAYNFAIGTTLPALTSGVLNTIYGGLGAGSALTSGGGNTLYGSYTGAALTTGTQNVFIGPKAGQTAIDVSGCIAIGYSALQALTSTAVTGTENNIAIGSSALANLASGYDQIAIGASAGANYNASETSNICIDNPGITGESFVTRLGSNQTAVYLAGASVAADPDSGVLLVSATNQLTNAGQGSAGEVLTSNGAGISPTWKPASAASLLTLSGNDTVPISPDGSGNINVVTTNSTFLINGSGSTLSLDFSDANQNYCIGSTLPALTSGSYNFVYGNSGAANSITSGSYNTIIGGYCGQSLSSGGQNIFIGTGAGQNATTANDCIALGSGALVLMGPTASPGYDQNIAIGSRSLEALTSGYQNIALGVGAGMGYTSSEFRNILISNPGVIADNNTTRIGSLQSRTFVSGITGVTVASSAPVLVDANGQLSSADFGAVSQVLTSNGAGVSPTWQPASGSSSLTLTPNSGGVVNPVSNNINVLGLPILAGQTVPLQTSTYNDTSPNLRIKAPNCCLFIVDANPLYGTHTTIQSAVNDAALIGSRQYVFIRPGTYVGNIALPALVSLVNFTCDQYAATVVIRGLITVASGSAASITGIELQNPSGSLIDMTAATIYLTLIDCNLIPQGGTGVLLGSTTNLILENCTGQLQANVAYFSATGLTGAPAGIAVFESILYNAFAATAQNTLTNCNLNIYNSIMQSAIKISGNCAVDARDTLFQVLNIPCYVANNSTGGTTFTKCTFLSGTGTAVTIASPAAVAMYACIVISANAATISGTGTLQYTPITFALTSTVTVTTQLALGSVGPRVPIGDGKTQLMSGLVTPNGIITAPKGSIYLSTVGTTTNNRLYINTNSATAWTAITTAT